MENYLYFAEAVVETGEDSLSEALCVPASNYIAADPLSATITEFRFKNAYGDPDGHHAVAITHTSGKNKEVIKAFMATMNETPTTGFVVMCDFETGTAVNKSTSIPGTFNGLGLSACAIKTVTGTGGNIRGTASGTALSTSYGVGILGTTTFTSPAYSRTQLANIIVTTVTIDLTGLKAKGSSAGDALGLGTTPAYFYKNVVAENGVIFKQTLSCLETATASGTVTTDINVAWNSAATIDYDEAAGTGAEINAGAMSAGAIIEDNTVAITADHYAYLTEGDTTASDAVFTAGVYMLTLYGAALPS